MKGGWGTSSLSVKESVSIRPLEWGKKNYNIPETLQKTAQQVTID